MKRRFVFGVFVLVAMIAALNFGGIVSAQKETSEETGARREAAPEASLLTDDFSYTAASLLTANGWTAHSGAGTNSPTVTASGLTYSGYAGSGVGNAAALTTTGEDVHRVFAVQSSGSVYAAVMVNVSEAAVDAAGLGGYFFHLGPDPISTTFRGRIYIQKNGSNNIAFGITKASSSVAGDVSFTPFSYSLNTTYLLIVKYTIVDGATNDTVSLFVNPALGGAEPAPTVIAPDVGASDINPGSVALRQGTASTHPTLTADGIRVGTAWADVAGSGGGGPVIGPKLFKAYLNSANEVPPNASTATGFGRIVLNAAEDSIKVSMYWNGLTGNATGGHIHGPAAAGVNAGIKFNLNPPAQSSGSVVDATFAVTPTDVTELKAGLWYFNIHTAANAGGEIRGQIGRSKPRFDTDGDGDSDWGLIRPGSGGAAGQATWYTSLNQQTPTDPNTVNQWGLNSDVATPGDFDGDGKADIAFWRPSGGSAFFILRSSTGTLQQVPFGQQGDDPSIVADYSGDGKADPAVYRPGATSNAASQFWTIPSSGPLANTQVVQTWGLGSDLATRGDFDGDGRYDLCVTRNFSGANVFIIYTQSGAISYRSWGIAGASADFTAPGDYDGDGITELAVTRIEGGSIVWYYLPSGGGASVRAAWGALASGDIEAQGDYDGDGKDDIAVWRSSGMASFFVAASTGGVLTKEWGLVQDFPSIYDLH